MKTELSRLRRWVHSAGVEEGLDWRDVLYPTVLSISFTALLFLRMTKQTTSYPGFPLNPDIKAYVALARNPYTYDFAPFSYRILVPWLAHYMPFSLQTNFMILAFAGLTLTGIVVYHIARVFDFDRATALLGVAMFFSLGWATEYNVWEFWRPEAVAFFFFALAFYAILADRDWLFVVALCFGVATKESVALIGPFYYAWHADSIVDRSVMKRTLLVGVIPFALFVGIRAFHPPFGSSPVQYYPAKIAHQLQNHAETFDIARIHEWTVQPFGVLLPLATVGAVVKRKLAFRLSCLVGLVYLQLLVAVSAMRLLVLAFPVVVVLALFGLRYLLSRINDRLSTAVRPVYFSPVFVALLLFETRPRDFYPVRFYVQCLLFAAAAIVLFVASKVQRRYITGKRRESTHHGG